MAVELVTNLKIDSPINGLNCTRFPFDGINLAHRVNIYLSISPCVSDATPSLSTPPPSTFHSSPLNGNSNLSLTLWLNYSLYFSLVSLSSLADEFPKFVTGAGTDSCTGADDRCRPAAQYHKTFHLLLRPWLQGHLQQSLLLQAGSHLWGLLLPLQGTATAHHVQVSCSPSLMPHLPLT